MLGLSAATSLFAPARHADEFGLLPGEGLSGLKPRKSFDGVTYEESETAKELDRLDPNKAQRALINVLAPQSGANFAEKDALIRELQSGEAYEPGGRMYDRSGDEADDEVDTAAEAFFSPSADKKDRPSNAAQAFLGD